MILAAFLGLAVGWPSRRLIGDYLAIVTLFFGEAFVEFTNNVAPSKLGGPNGIVSIDPFKIFGTTILSNKGYFYVLLVLLVATVAVLHLLDTSRTGRAWRAVREDPLASTMMTIPVNRVKLMAFAFGAAVAAMAGTVFAAQQINVFPTDFATPFLILIYAGLILGGAGSLAGAVLGGLILSVTLDGLLRSPTEAGYIFYGLILATMVVKIRPWARLGAILGATVVFGIAVHAIVKAISPSAVAGGPQSSGWISDLVHNWVVVPSHPTRAGNIGYVLLLVLVIALVQLKGRWRDIVMVPTLYLAACVWEGVLVAQPSITRQILLGVILIVMMNARPNGLLGRRRVEVV
jgi:ABC-type branched-subunit amino acid transport system permease subunit